MTGQTLKVLVAVGAVALVGWLLLDGGESETSATLDEIYVCLESEGFAVTVNTDSSPRLFVGTRIGFPPMDQGGASEVRELTLHEASATIDFYPDAEVAETFGEATARDIQPETPVRIIGSVVIYWPEPVPESDQDTIADCVTA